MVFEGFEALPKLVVHRQGNCTACTISKILHELLMDGVQEAEHGPGLGLGQTSLCDGQCDDVLAADDVASVVPHVKALFLKCLDISR